MTDAGLSVSDATVTYRNGHTALTKASFEIPRGTITALVGVNGAGKSTLFKAIMGFVPLARGRVEVLGQSARAALKQNLVAYVPQAEEVDWNFPVLVKEVVMMGRYGHMGFLRRPSSRDREMVAAALERVNMTAFSNRQIGELSGGQRKRVFLARALAQEGQVILLDEPFTGVDVKTEEQIIALLRRTARRGPDHAGLDPQSRLGARILRPGGVRQGHGAGLWPDGNHLHPGQSGDRPSAACCAISCLKALPCTTIEDTRRLKVITDDERPFVIYGERGTDTAPAARRGKRTAMLEHG